MNSCFGLFEVIDISYSKFSKSHKEHITWLTKHLLNTEGLSHKWSEIIISLVRKITMIVRPDVCEDNDDMDIRQYVQIKKVSMTSQMVNLGKEYPKFQT